MSWDNVMHGRSGEERGKHDRDDHKRDCKRDDHKKKKHDKKGVESILEKLLPGYFVDYLFLKNGNVYEDIWFSSYDEDNGLVYFTQDEGYTLILEVDRIEGLQL
ncbi:hypothetical protein [Alkalicoccobacillus porphyridii]|uniref:Uncharacterized protein n=1 Tax=Alkalicoccobacillus porphyridii TaxID=2597270 RepID=A0A553ZZG0_9BACI|nr:hypothetical protein [Alkalicoccobacillus porphyridii]TSB46813.1 hypothetical protein FN960_10760 [Alkalicoccobacillus porphyridii]